MEIKIINEQSIALYFKEEISESNYRDVESVTKHIHAKRIDGIKDVIPSYRTIMINFDNIKLNFKQLIDILDLKQLNGEHAKDISDKTIIHIPVLYNSEVGPDLLYVKFPIQISRLHVRFYAWFSILGGLDSRLHTPRRDEPRVKIDAGSVGITNNQTGLYPSDSPGGWQIIGRTPLKVFDINDDEMSLYQAGIILSFILLMKIHLTTSKVK